MMEQIRFGTPDKVPKYDSPLMNTPRLHMTPIKQNETRSRHKAYQNNTGCFTVLPSHITPPSRLTMVGKNPFEADLTNRLHLSMISPNIFAKVSTKSSQQSPEFTWSIDELAQIQPAKIEESLVQQVNSPDPEVELMAQKAIDRFFKENQIIPSPWENREKNNKLSINLDTPPSRPLEDLNSTKELSKLKKDVWSQTVLSLPMDLPKNVEDILKSFSTFTQEQTADSDDINLSNSSLRRKLFFNHDECVDDDNERFMSSSSIEMSTSMVLPSSPPQSGMFTRSTLKGSLQTKRQSDESKNLSSPFMSPIHNNENDMLYKRVIPCSNSNNRLDFTTDMSIDDVKESLDFNDDDLLDTSYDTNDMKCTEDNHKLIIVNNDNINLSDPVNMEVLSKCTNPFDTVNSAFTVFNDKDNDASKLKNATDIEKSSIHESYKQSNIMFNTFYPQNISNLIQDTGYQTYSMNSTMHTVNSYNCISINDELPSGEQILTFKDDTQLSWRENMKNVFSSTPSKSNKEK